MIIEALISVLGNIVSWLISGLSGIPKLPMELINVLGNITGLFSYIIGIDLLMIFVGCVTFWATAKLSVGVGIWLWKLLPFT